MISKELEKIIDAINAQGEMSVLEAATEECITAFENEHNIKLPKKYKEWLLFSDGGECLGVQFYGVTNGPTINIEDDNRPDDNYIVIGTLASGDSIIFKKSEEKIFIFNHENNRIENDETYEDFYAFLNDMLESKKGDSMPIAIKVLLVLVLIGVIVAIIGFGYYELKGLNTKFVKLT